MVSTDDLVPAGVDWPWTTALVVGPPLTGKGAFVVELLVAGLEEGEGAIVISTDESAADLRDRHPGLDCDAVRFIGASGTDSDDEHVSVVGSPADLTGIGMAFDDAVHDLTDAGYDRIRVGIDSVTTLEVYTDAERVSRFVHVLSNRFATANCIGLFVVHGDGSETEFASPIDARVEFREGRHGVERRIVGASGSTKWRQHDPATTSVLPTQGDDAPTPVNVSSLSWVLESVAAERLVLTVVNADPDVVDRLAPLFDRLQVDVRAGSLDVDEPSGAALLHRGGDLLAAEPVAPLLATAEGIDDPSTAQRGDSTVLERASRSIYSVETDQRSELVRTSRLVETMAARVTGGRIHAGFQQLSRLANDPETLRVYNRLAASGVDVHLYGAADAPLPDQFTVHGAPEPELDVTWFVVFDGDGDPNRMAALVAKEVEAGRYEGFWTYQPPLVAGLVAYLEAEYGTVRGSAPRT
ncbi:DUF7504 family protein [Halorarius litoreus]|uniref:DUF7504 family protein n=1 Tax=Halorarius litoreus TaxID=2962676 RepID=UPI0020CB895C|nr:ATPase domain-containing protein [Halorarius litoreus]